VKFESINVCPISLGDLPRVFEISLSVLDFKGWSLKALEEEFLSQRGVILGAWKEGSGERAGSFVGFLHYRTEEWGAYVVNLGVEKESQGQGFGKALMQWLFQALEEEGNSSREKKRVFLEVAERNLQAQSFYQSLGFLEVCKRRGFYSNGESAFSYERTL